MKNPKNSINGWLILDKSTGITSAKAVSKVKHLLKPKKIGHAGTLDPLASGILPLALGEATKTAGYMMGSTKSYIFTVSWGQECDTDDLEGEVTQTSDKIPSKEEITTILPDFIGEIEQTPPQYSAIKVDGKRAYDLARDGKVADIKSRIVRVDALEVMDTPSDELGETSFICHCGKGTYIRSLARDMGRLLGCYGHISMLRRIKVGKFSEKHAISLEILEEMMHKDDLGFLQPVVAALDDIPAVHITTVQAQALRQGRIVKISGEDIGVVAAFESQKLIALCEASPNCLKPKRVFNLD